MKVDDEKMAKYLYHGYEYSIVRNFKHNGVYNKEDALIYLKRLILINIRNFKINQERGRTNKINESIKKVLWYFKDNDFTKKTNHL